MKIRRASALLAPLAALGFIPAGALASSVEVHTSGGGRSEVVFTAGTGESNDVTVRRSGGSIKLTDPGSNMTSGTCTLAGHTATCARPPGTVITVGTYELGDGAKDSLKIAFAGTSSGGPFLNQAFGGAGRDTMVGSDGRADNDTLEGGTGNDTLNGRRGDDVLEDYDENQASSVTDPEGGTNRLLGGAGADELDGGPDADTEKGGSGNDDFRGGLGHNKLSGGAGFDFVEYPELDYYAGTFPPIPTGLGIAVNLAKHSARNRGSGGPTVRDRLSGIEDVFGTIAADVILGDRGANDLGGGNGRDRIVGGKGADQLYGGLGRDLLKAKDQAADRVSCGGNPGDRAKHDKRDEVSGC